VITATEHEAAQLEDANAKSALVAAQSNLDQARQRREDARVTAPIAGTILAKPVSVGTVISSATSSASGGTTILDYGRPVAHPHARARGGDRRRQGAAR
jgi:multidrug efflux pump subunit AcrA (membrane-fusion protein)